MLVGPQERAIKIVDDAVTVRPQNGHVSGRVDQLLLQLRLTRLGPARGKADGPARAHRRQFAHHIDGGKAVDADEGGIGWLWQIGQRGVGLQPTNLRFRRMHRPDRAFEAHLLALFDDIQRPACAENGDGLGAQEAVQGFHLRGSLCVTPGGASPPGPPEDI